MRDSGVIGLISGIAGGIVFQVFIWISTIFGIAGVTPSQIGAYLFANSTEITTLSAQIIGMVAHLINSAILGVILVYILRLMGTDYLWVKGVAYGGAIHLLAYGAILRIFIPVKVLQPNLPTSLVFFISHIIFGIVTVFVAGHYLKEGFRTNR